jgi:N6-adenosine-specific RNA methylase IME4
MRVLDFDPKSLGEFDIIYADPPWDYGGPTQHGGVGGASTGGAASHYPTMKLDELCALPVAAISAPDALLFLWTTGPKVGDAVKLGEAWGFAFITVAFVWDKQATNPGNYTMSQTEQVFVFKRGRIPKPRGSRNERQIVSAPRGRHSAKPSEVRSRIERMFPTQRKIELFARESAPNWTAWGNEVPCAS